MRTSCCVGKTKANLVAEASCIISPKKTSRFSPLFVRKKGGDVAEKSENHGFLWWNAPGNWYRSHLRYFIPKNRRFTAAKMAWKFRGCNEVLLVVVFYPDVWPHKNLYNGYRGCCWNLWQSKKTCKNLQETTLYSFQLGNFSWRMFMISPHQRVAEFCPVHSSFACFN